MILEAAVDVQCAGGKRICSIGADFDVSGSVCSAGLRESSRAGVADILIVCGQLPCAAQIIRATGAGIEAKIETVRIAYGITKIEFVPPVCVNVPVPE